MNGDWLEGLAAHGCTFVELVKDGKRPRRALDHYRNMTGRRGTEAARHWLRKGSPVGILIKPPLWVLDADSAKQVERVVSELFDHGITPLMVATPSNGAHFYGILPDDFPLERLKNHHPDRSVPIDYKFGPSTLVVCPGSSRKGIEYHPMTAWTTPPIVDPRWFKADGFWHERDTRPFLTNPRPLKDRLIAARRYLDVKAPVSVSEDHGHRTLTGVCSHLVAFHRIPPRTALTMLAPWNARCTDLIGNSYPWSREELIAALDAAVDSVPEAGVKAYQQAEAAQEERNRVAAHVELIKAARRSENAPVVPVERVRRLLRWFGLDLTATALGDALRLAGVARVKFTKRKIQGISNLDYPALVTALLTHKRDHFARDLKKHEPSPPSDTMPVERVVSGPQAIKTRVIPAFCLENNQSLRAA